MIQLWTQDEVTFEGKYYKVKGAVLEPKPVQKPYPQLLFGGGERRMLQLTGKYADICFIPPFSQDPDFYEKGKNIALDAAEGAKRKGELEFMTGFMGLLEPFSIKKSFESVEAAIKMGASYFLIAFPQNESHPHLMKKFAQEVMPCYK